LIFFFILPSMLVVAAARPIAGIQYLFPMMSRFIKTKEPKTMNETLMQTGIWVAAGGNDLLSGVDLAGTN
jgi:hypothetical protein